MATFTFDGTSNITATKDDTVFISANPQTFTQASDNGSSVTLNFGSTALTITGTTLAAGNLPNVYVTGGQFAYAGTTGTGGTVGNVDTPATTGNVLSFLVPTGTAYTAPTTTADSKVAIFGGLGRSDSIDGIDSITFGGKGSFFVHGNGGGDSIAQSATAFDSTSTVNVFGDGGDDRIALTTSGNQAPIYVGGGDGADSIAVVNSGLTFIQGGLDSTDGGDSITLNAGGTSTTALKSTSYIYGNGGADTIAVTALDSTSSTTIFGGFGNDSISVGGSKSAITIIGGEGSDSIYVNNNGSGGSVFITGGNPSGGDQSLDLGDSITIVSARNEIAVYGNAGADTINLIGKPDDANINVYGGKDNDIINIANTPFSTNTADTTTARVGYEESSIFVAGGEGSDTITLGPAAVGNNSKVADTASIVTIYGGTSASDSADGADSITISGGATGVINVYGNGGNDSIQIGSLGNDSAHTVTIYGGGGADSISVGVQNTGTTASTIANPVNEQLVINTNEGADTISIAHSGTYAANVSAQSAAATATGNSTGQTVTIADFTIGGASADQLKITGASNSTLQVVAQPSGGAFQTIQQALDAAANATTGGTGSGGASKAAAVVFGGNTYVVVNGDGNGTYSATADQAIKLTGVTDLVGLVGQTTITTA